MKQGLQLKLTQQLTMTPQLQQAIRLLQLSSLELQQEIEQALESNPLLELDEKFDEIKATQKESSDETDTHDMLEQQVFPDELPVDTQWDDYYSSSPSHTSSSYDFSDDDFPVYQGETEDTLYDHLMWQINLTRFTETDKAIAITIIESIDDSGYLTQSIDELEESLGIPEIGQEEIEIVLKQIQHFDPLGVGARNLQECLQIQLDQMPTQTPYLNEAKLIISRYLELLASHDYRTLIKKSKFSEERIKGAILLIQSLDPKPGETAYPAKSDYVIPDVFVRKVQGQWRVSLNSDCIPDIRINEHYAQLADSRSSDDTQFIRNNLQEARWLIKSLESRNETLLKVSECIVEQQQAFFEKGEAYMKPMILADIADRVEMHESTISRVTTQKYLHSPRGIFELKYFFSSHVNTQGGGEASSTAIKALIQSLIADENPKKPLSDNKIVELLSKEGMIVARRTVAKYREAMSIPSSSQRKSLI